MEKVNATKTVAVTIPRDLINLVEKLASTYDVPESAIYRCAVVTLLDKIGYNKTTGTYTSFADIYSKVFSSNTSL